MSLAPLLDASTWIQVHAVSALLALAIGAIQLLRVKGDATHRVLGMAWAVSMALAAATSFGIHEIDQWRGFSVIHLLSINTLLTLPVAVLFARRGEIVRHRRAMQLVYWTGLVIPGLLTLLPGRIMARVVFGG